MFLGMLYVFEMRMKQKPSAREIFPYMSLNFFVYHSFSFSFFIFFLHQHKVSPHFLAIAIMTHVIGFYFPFLSPLLLVAL